MKNYGRKGQRVENILEVRTTESNQMEFAVRADYQYPCAFLNLEEVKDLITQLTDWLTTQQKGLKP